MLCANIFPTTPSHILILPSHSFREKKECACCCFPSFYATIKTPFYFHIYFIFVGSSNREREGKKLYYTMPHVLWKTTLKDAKVLNFNVMNSSGGKKRIIEDWINQIMSLFFWRQRSYCRISKQNWNRKLSFQRLWLLCQSWKTPKTDPNCLQQHWWRCWGQRAWPCTQLLHSSLCNKRTRYQSPHGPSLVAWWRTDCWNWLFVC